MSPSSPSIEKFGNLEISILNLIYLKWAKTCFSKNNKGTLKNAVFKGNFKY